jgi:hypothetical protein
MPVNIGLNLMVERSPVEPRFSRHHRHALTQIKKPESAVTMNTSQTMGLADFKLPGHEGFERWLIKRRQARVRFAVPDSFPRGRRHGAKSAASRPAQIFDSSP